MKRRIWIDTDVALGSSSGDVDDGFAITAVAQAAKKRPEEVELLGVSVVSGNTDAKTAEDAAKS